MIIIDNITQASSNSAPFTFTHSVASSDEIVLVWLEFADSTLNSLANTSSATLNGNNMIKISSGTANFQSNASFGSADVVPFIYLYPPVGPVSIKVNLNTSGDTSTSTFYVTTVSLIGASKVTSNYLAISSVGSASGQNSIINSTNFNIPVNGLVLGAVAVANSGGSFQITTTDWKQLTNFSDSNTNAFGIANLYINGASDVNVRPNWSWTSSAACVAGEILIPEANSPSIWHPNLQLRNSIDVSEYLNAGASLANNVTGYYPSIFFQNSFLHTIGRRLYDFVNIATITSETEQETAQIIIDKVFQGQKTAVALSTVTLTMDISIPSPDAVLVVTGGSVIATGAAWVDVNFNGTKLTNLVQAIQTGADAEIWYLPYPSVGVGRLTITSGTGGEIYANAMVILGVDKRSTNIMTASATDAASTSTIGALITPDAPNSLLIDTLSTLNATASPVWDSSQTQVFNGTALASNEYVLSTYKLASGQQNMNYNLSVAVNAALVAVSFRPANAASMWFPNIDFREIDDVVTVAGLDSETNPAFGQYGYKPTLFFQNSFLHTIGRMNRNFPAAQTTSSSLLLMIGVG